MEKKLIEAVRIRQVLYDTNHADYMRTKLKAEKWEEIAKEVEMKNGTEAKALWEKLRHSLRDAFRRQQKCFKSGAPAESIKEWKYQKQMGFLQPYMANKLREGYLQEDSENENLTEHFLANLTSAEVDDVKVEVTTQQQNKSIDDEAQPQTLPETSSSRALQTPTSAKRFKKDNVTALLKQSMEKHEEGATAGTEERRNILQQFMPTEDDPLFHFFMSMYLSTKRMPPSYWHIVRNRVFNAVSDVEAMLLDSPGQQQPHFRHLVPASSHSTSAYSCSDNSHFSLSDAPEEQENFLDELDTKLFIKQNILVEEEVLTTDNDNCNQMDFK